MTALERQMDKDRLLQFALDEILVLTKGLRKIIDGAMHNKLDVIDSMVMDLARRHGIDMSDKGKDNG